MTPANAINALKEQKAKLSKSDHYNEVWTTKTKTLIGEFFGKDSEQYTFIEKFRFYTEIFISDYPERNMRENARKAELFMDDCIHEIERKGLFKMPKKNILSRVDNVTLAAYIFPILAIIGTSCYAWGKYISDVQNIEINHEVKTLKDSVVVLRQQLKATQTKTSNIRR
jgi:hypothetical protein